MGRRATVIGVTVAVYLGVVAVFLLAVSWLLRGPERGGVYFGPRVAIVELEGVILDVQDIVSDLKAYRENPLVRAVVVRINSPGGVVGPTQELHDALMRIRAAGKPVIASLSSVAASGGYYVAVAADKIVANPGTLTGSIGVVMQLPNVEQLLKKVGVDYIVVKAGRYKDIGSFARGMTPEERRVLETLLDDVHGQFITAVAEGRKLDRDAVVKFADGRIFSGTQAKGLGMVDELGGLEDAVNMAARMAGLAIPPRLIEPHRRFSVFDFLRSQLGWRAAGGLIPALPTFKTPLYLMD